MYLSISCKPVWFAAELCGRVDSDKEEGKRQISSGKPR